MVQPASADISTKSEMIFLTQRYDIRRAVSPNEGPAALAPLRARKSSQRSGKSCRDAEIAIHSCGIAASECTGDCRGSASEPPGA